MLRYAKMVKVCYVKLCEVGYAKEYVKLSKGMLRTAVLRYVKICEVL